MLKVNLKKISALLIALLIMLSFLLPVFAAPTSTVVLTNRGSISLTLRDNKTEATAAGVYFSLYQVASVQSNDGNLSFVFNSDFEDCGANLDNIGSENLANHLTAFAEKKALSPLTSGVTDKNGYLQFSDLTLGLYLISQKKVETADYIVSAFLVTVPIQTGDNWIYDVDASPKTEAVQKPVTPEKTQLAVRKVWKSSTNTHPGSASFVLLRDGSVYASVTLNEDNGWLYAWDNLDASYSWNIAEIDVPSGYTVSYSESGTLITATNTSKNYIPPTTPPTSDSENHFYKTGQTNWPIPVFAGIGTLLFAVGWLLTKRKSSRE